MRSLSALLGVAYLLPIVTATPAWNTVNGNFPNGTSCPLPTYYSYPCPTICVRDISQCPPSVRPSCPAGQTFCVDGECRDSCPTGLVSQCACPGQPDLSGEMYSCMQQFQNIENFVATNKF
ncbi:unnamed protein product [Absidia cylindrospora]